MLIITSWTLLDQMVVISLAKATTLSSAPLRGSLLPRGNKDETTTSLLLVAPRTTEAAVKRHFLTTKGTLGQLSSLSTAVVPSIPAGNLPYRRIPQLEMRSLHGLGSIGSATARCT